MLKILLFSFVVWIECVQNTSENEKRCRFMSPHHPNITQLEVRSLWNQLTGFFCYFYTDERRLNFTYNVSQFKVDDSYIYATRIDNSTFFLYDYLNKTSLQYIRLSFKNNIFFEKWKTCSREAAECCDDFMNSDNIDPVAEYQCPAVWDSWTCFKPAKPNTTSRETCPVVTYSTESRACELKSERECYMDGWNNRTNYNTCAIAPVLRERHLYHIILLAVAAVTCLPAVIIFFSFYNLRHKVVLILHRNLILMIIIRNLLTIMTKELLIMSALSSTDEYTVLTENGVSCRVLVFFENISKNGIFACMFVDGYYLHYTIVTPFATEPQLMYMYMVVAILSFLPSLIWALLRGLHDGDNCWIIDSSNDHWLISGFRLAILVVNALLLLDIIRVVVFRLRHKKISQQAKVTLKVTLLLFPLFGIQLMIMSNRGIVPGDTCAAQDIYYYTSYSIEGLQGILVALLFCYLNLEVRREIGKAIGKVVLSVTTKTKTTKKRRDTKETIVQ